MKLYYSERKLWDECPDARPVIERLARMRASRSLSLTRIVVAGFVYALLVACGVAGSLSLLGSRLNYGGLAACVFCGYVTGAIVRGGK